MKRPRSTSRALCAAAPYGVAAGIVAAAVALAVAVSPAPAHAAPAQAGSKAAPPAAASESDRAAAMRRAEAMATEAKALFHNRVFSDAARLYMEAFAIIRRATLVYNAARAYEEDGRLKRAESLFLLYRSLPDADPAGKADADEHLAALRARITKGEDKPDEPAAPADKGGVAAVVVPPPVVVAPPPPSRWPFVAAAVGAGVAGGLYGGALWMAGGLDRAEVVDDASSARYANRRDQAGAMRWAGAGVAVAAVAVAAYGALRPSTAAAKVPAGAGGASLTLGASPRGVGLALTF